MNDLEIIKKYTQEFKPDMPYLRWILEDLGGLPKEEVNKIIENITPEQIEKLYTEDL